MKLSSLAIPSALLILAVAFQSATAQSRVWTSKDGRALAGEFVRTKGTSLTIKRSDGRETVIPFEHLSEGDQKVAQDLQTKAEETLKEEALLSEAEKAAAKERKNFLEGPITYQLSGGFEKWPADRKKRIVDAMEEAIIFMNKNAKFKKNLTANNSPGTPTADANYDGWINWGGSISRRVALHEIAHTLGIGTHPNWGSNIKDGKWTGKHASELIKEFDGPKAQLSADRMHFWPYGLNQDNESSRENDLRFLKILEAMRKDMGIE